ncbi:hypothetical protein MHO82_24300 [Vibrio sp. Of7-15]|uniref:hypothetical protein n=1 Tax=Vibrio sp. Of7-15 TaxID=2724879 RepID=UPI001EF26E13|nr:hypothetical protein [Vibrio sp. Of7-15]MCG7499991.1 hypothetical protein [Vibrio sp. Of7-15]
MKKMNMAYRLQLIKEVARRREIEATGDAMSVHIYQLVESQKEAVGVDYKDRTSFVGNHYDEHAGGWVSDDWLSMK